MSVQGRGRRCHARDVEPLNLGDNPDAVRARWLELRQIDDEIAYGNKAPNEAIPKTEIGVSDLPPPTG